MDIMTVFLRMKSLPRARVLIHVLLIKGIASQSLGIYVLELLGPLPYLAKR